MDCNGELGVFVERGDTLTYHSLLPSDSPRATGVVSATGTGAVPNSAATKDAEPPPVVVGFGSALAASGRRSAAWRPLTVP